MFARWLTPLVVLAFLAPVAVRAEGDKETKKAPTLVVSIKSVDDLLADAKHVAKLIGKEDEADQIDGLIKAKMGDEGLEGIDTKRPIGVYGFLEESVIDSAVVVLVPIKEEKSFLALLKNFELEPEKDDDGIYTLAPDGLPFEIYFRFANKYAYVTIRDKACLAKKALLDPATVLGKEPSTASMTFRIDQVPGDLKKIFLSQLDLKLEETEEKQPGEDDIQHQARVKAQKGIAKQVAWVVKEGKEATARFNIDRVKNEIVAEWKLTGTDGSTLAKSIKDLENAKSLFAKMVGKDSAASVVMHGKLPEYVSEVFTDAFKQGFEKDMDNKDEGTKRLMKKLYACIEPTFKSGDVDSLVTLRGPNKDHKYTALAGVHIVDGHKLEGVLKDAIKAIPDEKKRKQVELDVATEGDLHIHKLTIDKAMRGDAKRLFGDGPIYIGVRKDCVLVAVGPEALEVLKDAAEAKKGTCPPVDVEVSLARLFWAIGKIDEEKGSDLLKKAFEGKKGADKIRFVVEGGDSLKARFDMKLTVLKFVAEVDSLKKAQRKTRSQDE